MKGMDSNCCRYTVALPGPGPIADRLQESKTPFMFMPMEGWRVWVRDPVQRLKFILTLPFQVVSIVRWVRFLRREQPDLVHFNINRLVEPVLAARLLRIRSVMHFRDIPSRMQFRFALGSRAFYFFMNFSEYWIANSSATARDIQSHAKRPVRVIPNGLDLVVFDQMAKANDGSKEICNFGANSFKVAMIAGLTPWKNHAAFIKVAQLVSAKREDIVFFLAGSGDPEYLSELERLAQDTGVADRMKFLGHVENIPGFLKTIDLLVHTTDREPFGRVLIEAMAARLPVVAFNSGGAAEIILNGETGVLIPPGNLEAMADAVSRLMDDPLLRRRMGETGRKRVEKHYTLERHCLAVITLYAEVVDSRDKINVQ